MNKRSATVLVFLAILLVACGSKHLTQEQVETAVNKGMYTVRARYHLPRAEVSVLGVTEDQNANSAEADLRFANATFATEIQPCEWRGGKAVFKRYNEQGWTLTAIQVTDSNHTDYCNAEFPLNIPVQ